MGIPVLLVDSSLAMQKVISIALKDTDYNCQMHDKVDYIFQYLQENQNPLLLIDASFVTHPNIIQQILHKNSKSKIIILVGSTSQINEAELKSIGVSAFLKKPFDKGQLLQILDQHSSNNQHTRTNQSTQTISTQNYSSPKIAAEIPAQIQTDRKGRKAFLEEVEKEIANEVMAKVSVNPELKSPEPIKTDRQGAVSGSTDEEIKKILMSQLPKLVEKEVKQYCEEHFDGVVKEVVETELRRLASERARHLLDN